MRVHADRIDIIIIIINTYTYVVVDERKKEKMMNAFHSYVTTAIRHRAVRDRSSL